MNVLRDGMATQCKQKSVETSKRPSGSGLSARSASNADNAELNARDRATGQPSLVRPRRRFDKITRLRDL